MIGTGIWSFLEEAHLDILLIFISTVSSRSTKRPSHHCERECRNKQGIHRHTLPGTAKKCTYLMVVSHTKLIFCMMSCLDLWQSTLTWIFEGIEQSHPNVNCDSQIVQDLNGPCRHSILRQRKSKEGQGIGNTNNPPASDHAEPTVLNSQRTFNGPWSSTDPTRGSTNSFLKVTVVVWFCSRVDAKPCV